MDRTYVALDAEFTGLDPHRDRIIEIGMVMFRGDEVLETFSSLVRSERPVPYKIQLLSGITQEEVSQAPELGSLHGRILSFVKSYPLVGHTIEMDLRFLANQRIALNNLAVDTFELATILFPEVHHYSLANLSTVLELDIPEHHRALADAMATKGLFLALMERARQWDPALLDELARLARGTGWPLRQVFQDILNERGGSQRLFKRVGARGGQRERVALQVDEELPPLEPAQEIRPIDASELAQIIAPGGVFEKQFPGYEHRPQQIEMLRAVAEALNTPSHLVVEAGTGTGKSLAYLLPAVHFATQNGERVIISSNTINLQEQLYRKDIPDLLRILPMDFQATILKGRSNYLCMHRLTALRRSRQLTIDELRVLAKVLAWLPITKTGDRSELTLIDAERGVWSQLQASVETCLGERCPYRAQGQCFFYRARERADRSHLVIVNHALLLSDLALERRVLGDYGYLIIDEAQHLEEQATRQFSFEASRRDVYAFLSALSHQGGDAPGGLLAAVPALYQDQGVGESDQTALAALIEGLGTQVDSATRRLYEMFNILERFFEQNDNSKAKGNYDRNIRLTSGIRVQPDWSQVEIAWDNLSAPWRQILHDLQRLGARLERLEPADQFERDQLLQEVQFELQTGSELVKGLEEILTDPKDQGIYWASISGRTQELSLCSAPLHVGSTLQERLFHDVKSVIMTSATLTTNGSFHFIEERLGLEDPMESCLDSPFDFKTAALLYVPKDIPEPSQPYYQRQVEQAIISLCKATEGRALILFTSNSQLHRTYRAVQRPLEEDQIVIFGQGIDGSRRQILESFRTTPRAVLFGTRSFWEGVDVVGQALSCLVITRLPFGVPTDPILAARAETFEDPFNNCAIPFRGTGS